jgi:serine/threonine protein kinase
LESLHARNYIHRDIKPENFMVGFDKRVYLIDFGLAQTFRDHTTLMHTPLVTGLDLIGSVRYTSINSHMGLQQARRDDLESLAYTLLYIRCGKLPWQSIAIRNPSRHRAAVLRKKKEICQSCDTVTIPLPLVKFIQYARSLAFEDNPNYNYLHSVLEELYVE